MNPSAYPNITFDLAGKTRDLPVSDSYLTMLDAAARRTDPSLGIRIVSGGQAPKGSGGKRTGSDRHDVDHTGHAHTSDLVLTRNGRDILPGQDKPLYASFLRNAAAEGFTGLGHYDWGVHVGGGSEAAWGPSTGSSDLDPVFGSAIEEGRRMRKGGGQTGGGTSPSAQAFAFFVSKGWSPEQAAGIVGNLMQESGLRTTAVNRGDGSDGSNSIGVAQWNSDRALGLKAFAKSRGAGSGDFLTQLEYVNHELETTEGQAGRALRAARTVDEATAAFIGFERPYGWSPENPRGGHGWANRLAHAEAALRGGSGELPAAASTYPEGEPSTLNLWDSNPYADIRPEQPYTRQEVAALGPRDDDDYDLADSFANTFTAAAYRKLTEGAFDPTWEGPTAEEWDEVSKTMPAAYYDFVMGSGSQKAYENRLAYVREDVARQERRGEAGIGGVLLDLATGMFDPVTLPLNVATGGLGASLAKGAMGATRVGRAAAGALAGGVSNAAIEAGLGAATDTPHADPLMAFGIGAVLGGVGGALARNPATQWEARELAASGRAAQAQARDPAAVPYIVGGDGSMGAASSGVTLSDWHVDPHDVPTAAFGSVRFDVLGQMTTSQEPRTRLMGWLLGEEPVGRTDHGVIDDPVSVVRRDLELRRWAPVEKTFPAARDAWMKDQNVGWSWVKRDRASREFARLVSDAVWSTTPDPDASPHVLRAADAYRGFYDLYRKDYENPRWESGGYAEPLADVKANPNYLPLYANHEKIGDVAHRVPERTMERFIRGAILSRTPDMDPKDADRMARGYWINLRRAGYGIEDQADLAVTLGDRELFQKAFLQAAPDFDVDELDRMFDVLTGMTKNAVEAGDAGKPARLKRRTLMDHNYEAEVEGFGRLKVRDLFNQDVEFITRRYNRTMSARVALAQIQVRNPRTGELFMDGIRSDADVDKLKNWVREGWQEAAAGHYGTGRDGLDRAMANIDHMLAAIHGTPIYGSDRQLGQFVRRVKTFQFIRLMNNMGLNQVQETWKLVATLGARASFKQLPAIRRMVDGAGRDQPAADALLRELEDHTGFGLEGFFGRHEFALMEDRLGAIERGRTVSRVDAALDIGQRATSALSFMRAIQTFQQRWAIKAIAQRLHDLAEATAVRGEDGGAVRFDFSRLKGRERERLAAAGFGPEEARLVLSQMLQHGEKEGGRLVGLGLNKWDPQALTKFTRTMNRMANRIVQANDVGAMAKWMSQPLAQLFTQFRTFVLGAWSKSTLYNIHHFDPDTFVLVMGEIAFGTATYALRAAGTQAFTEEGREKFWTETMDPANLVKNGFARSASASLVPMFADAALMFTPAGAQFGSARSSGSPMDPFVGSPAAGLVEGAYRFVKGAGESLVSGEEMTAAELRAGWRSLPFANWLPLMGVFESMIAGRE